MYHQIQQYMETDYNYSYVTERWGKLQHATTCSCVARYVAILIISLPLLYVCTYLATYYMSVLQVTEKLQLTTDFYSYGKSHWPINLNYTIKNTVGE